MRSIATLIVFLLGINAAVYAQSLAEVARKERERRAQVTAQAKVITNQDTIKYRNSPVTTQSIPAPQVVVPPAGQPAPGTAPLEVAPGPPKPAPGESTDYQGRPESFWRQTFMDARKKLKDLEAEERVLTLKAADLQNQFYKESSGFRQQQIQRDLQKTFSEQEQNKINLAKAKAELEDLEKEARKSGALPGWMNPKP